MKISKQYTTRHSRGTRGPIVVVKLYDDASDWSDVKVVTIRAHADDYRIEDAPRTEQSNEKAHALGLALCKILEGQGFGKSYLNHQT